ncbi:MAG: hypothetical protein GXP59_09760 [Deltaproteobacteria bacterium]|nr:hypothetical protein [Deltaproteobacteria bacterium]
MLSNKLSENLFGSGKNTLLGSDSAQVFDAELKDFWDRVREAGQIDRLLSIAGKSYTAKGVKILTDRGQEGVIMAFIPVVPAVNVLQKE